MTTQYIYDLVDTWNDGATTFTAIKMNVTDTASNAASLLMDLQVGGASKFKVSKGGIVTADRFLGTASPSVAEVSICNSSGARQAGMFFGFGGVLPGFTLNNTGAISWDSSASPVTGTPDTILTRRAAANLRLGAADAAAPVAQTLSVQSVVAGTTNTAGTNLTITGSQGTGTGAGGSIIFQVAPAGGSGTAQNTPVDALTIASNKDATFGNDISCSGNMGLGGAIWSGNSSTTGYSNAGVGLINSSGGLILGSSKYIAWVNAANLIGTQDLILARDDANKLALRNGTAAQTFRVYNTYDGTNNEWGALDWVLNATSLSVGTFKSGSGSSRALQFVVGGTNIATFAASGHMLWNTDNTYDIGASGATRPRSVYAGTSITPGAGVVVASLPTPSTGMIARVTNALAPTIGSTVVGGGAAYALVNYNGANWTVIGV